MPTPNRTVYPASIADLLTNLPLAPLGPGRPDESRRASLEVLRLQAGDLPLTCQAGLWLAYDFLEESHKLSQEITSAEGSYWHAIMHRREPDHSNAAYWLGKVGRHPIHTDLAQAAAELGHGGREAGWDAFAFNDACERHRGKGDVTEDLLRQVQRVEWQLLFAYCFIQAPGRTERR